jgi:DNA-binding MarR family transcriptional regulator
MNAPRPPIITWNTAESEVAQCIAIRYTYKMAADVTTEEYRALAELRYRIRHFLREGDAVAHAAGLEPQQYLLLLMIRGLKDGEEATIRTLAERLALKHHSAVELIDRLEMNGYVRRNRGRDDRRRVIVSLLPRGERILEDVARQRIDELRSYGHQLVQAISQLLDKTHKYKGNHQPKKGAMKHLRGSHG